MNKRQKEIITNILSKRYVELELKTSIGMASSVDIEEFNQLKELLNKWQ